MMNEVFLSGKIASISTLTPMSHKCVHLMLQVCISHQNREKKMKREIYAVNTWNRLAQWANRNLEPGMPITIQGYLSQHKGDNGRMTEITAKRILISQTRSSAKETQNLQE